MGDVVCFPTKLILDLVQLRTKVVFAFRKTTKTTFVAIPNCTLWSSFAFLTKNDDGLRWDLYTLSRKWSLFAFLLQISQAHGLAKFLWKLITSHLP